MKNDELACLIQEALSEKEELLKEISWAGQEHCDMEERQFEQEERID